MPGYFSLRKSNDGWLHVRCRQCGEFALVQEHEQAVTVITVHVRAVHRGYRPTAWSTAG